MALNTPLKDLLSMLTEMSPQVNYLSYHLASFFLSYQLVFNMELLFESVELKSLKVSINWSFLVYVIHAL